jgi:deoxycytidylate deaminase
MPLTSDDICTMIEDSNISHSKHRTSLHYAILYRRGKVLATATNAVGSRSKGCGYSNHTIHAERAVIKKVGDVTLLKDAELFVVRLSKTDKSSFMNSEPCHACKRHLTKCMREYGLKAVYYS